MSVALQLPESEARGLQNTRLTDKFPSTTTFWLILRKFEAGVAGGSGAKKNFTARGTPRTDGGTSGGGRLYHERPVLQVMGRELSSFTDLQKSLSQLGITSGGVLIRLEFRLSDEPLEAAMAQIEEYFKPETESAAVVEETPQEKLFISEPKPTETTSETLDTVMHEIPPEPPNVPEPASTTETSQDSKEVCQSQGGSEQAPTTTSSGRAIEVFAPPPSATPSAALTAHNPADYTPTIEHAQKHQRLLSQSSRNTRLLTDAELAAQAEAEKERLAAIADVQIKIRFPDETSISMKFDQNDTGASLYAAVRECLSERLLGEPFVLRNAGVRGKEGVVPAVEGRKLIQGLGLKGRVMVVFEWDDEKASLEARMEKRVLRASLRERARPIKVEEVGGVDGDEDGDEGRRVTIKKENQGGGAEEKKKGFPKWLKGLSKK